MKNEAKTKAVVKVKTKSAKGGNDSAEDVVAENLPMPIVRKSEDLPSLEIIESGIIRDLLLASRLDKASAMISIKIGIALNSAKTMLRSGEYGPWIGAKFGDKFGMRKAQYCAKLANVFATAQQGRLALPAPKEAGNWLAVQNEGSALFSCVEQFVGDMTFAELLEHHHIKIAKEKGGWRPSEILLNRFVMDHKDLVGVPFESWTEEQKDEFRAWADANNDGNSAEARTMAAEGAWASIRGSLEEHGMSRASWKLLSHKALADTADVLKDVLADIQKALKQIDKSK